MIIRRWAQITIFLLLAWVSSQALAYSTQAPLPVDKAFPVSVQWQSPNTLLAQWQVAPGYHLYKKRIQFEILGPTGSKITQITMPPGHEMEDAILGKFQGYTGDVLVPIEVRHPSDKPLKIAVFYQGCSDSNFCYPPEKRVFQLANEGPATIIDSATTDTVMETSPQNHAEELLDKKNLWLIALGFLGLGFLLSLTPCVLPMIPILSGIIAGQGHRTNTLHAFLLSVTYVLAMSFTYALAGVAAASLGHSVQAALQTPVAISLFSLLFVLLALSLFGFYELKMPDAITSRLTKIGGHQRHGSYISAFVMGVLATLIVSPCVTAPLVGVLAYIGNTGDTLIGATALFFMGLGMGVPLLLVGIFHGKFLPKAGAWMNTVKAAFGVLMLGMAIWLLSRIIPGALTLALWATLLIVTAVFMGLLRSPENRSQLFWRGVSLVMAIYGVLLLIGAAQGNHNPLRPLTPLAHSSALQHELFTPVKTVSDVDHQLQTAQQQQQPTVLDFYADWCVACKEMEATTFSDPTVIKALAKYKRLQANVTANDATDKRLEKQYGVVAPPTLIFFDSQGRELKQYRIVGAMGPKEFLAHLEAISASTQASESSTQ